MQISYSESTVKRAHLLHSTAVSDMTLDQSEHPKKHHHESLPQDGVEQIYHDWLKRDRATKEIQEMSEGKDQTKQSAELESDSESRSDQE